MDKTTKRHDDENRAVHFMSIVSIEYCELFGCTYFLRARGLNYQHTVQKKTTE